MLDYIARQTRENKMKLSRFLPAMILCFFAASPSWAKLSLEQISAYVNDIKGVKASFTQVNANGSQSTGQIYIKRPGKMRFEYDPPNQSLVLASSGKLAVYDENSNTPPKIYPLRRTPLILILERNVDFTKNGMIVSHEEKGQFTSVLLRDPRKPEMGTAELIFSNNPIALRQWVITDQSKRRTTLLLGDLQPQKNLPRKLFFIDPNPDD